MKKLIAVMFAVAAMTFLTSSSAEAQHFNRGFGGWGGSGISFSVGRGGFGPGFGPAFGFNSFGINSGFVGVGPGFYRARPVYRVPVHSGFRHSGFYRGGGFHGGGFYGGRRGCGW
jgi:hypothetical protein